MPIAESNSGLPSTATAQQHVHHYIDQRELTWHHWKIWISSAGGLMVGGYSFFMIGIIIPLLRADQNFPVSTLQAGAIAAAAIVGTLLGSLIFGSLSDRYGRKLFYRLDQLILIVFGTLTVFSPNAWWIVMFQVLFGMGIGGDYPIAQAYVSEVMPAKVRSRMVAGVIAFQAVGGLLAAVIGFVLLRAYPDLFEWHWLMATVVPIAAILFILRLTVPESPKWLAEQGRIEEARVALKQMLGPDASLSIPETASVEKSDKVSIADLFVPGMLRKTLLLCIPWPCMDIAVYGIGIFTPLILTNMHLRSDFSSKASPFIATRLSAIRGSSILDIFLVFGFILGILLMGRTTRIQMQVIGFLCMAAGLFLVALGSMRGNDLPLIFSGFILFNTMINAGPNLSTYTLPSEVLPVKLRATGAGLAAACGKTGATIGTFFFPIVMTHIGVPGTLAIVASLAIAGAAVTYFLRVPVVAPENQST